MVKIGTTGRLLGLFVAAVFVAVFLPAGTEAGCGNTYEGASFFNGTCMLVTQELMTWFEASMYCTLMGFEQVRIHDDWDNVALWHILALVQVNGDFWISGHDMFREGKWYWEDFEFTDGIQEQDYLNWAPGHPTVSRDNNCMYMTYRGDDDKGDEDLDLTWKEANCRSRKHALCSQFTTAN